MNEANICESNGSVRTVGRFLNSKGYYGPEKKGCLLTMRRAYALHLPKKVREQYDKESGAPQVLLRTRPTRWTKHELLLEGSTEKNQKVSTSIAQRQGVKLDLEKR